MSLASASAAAGGCVKYGRTAASKRPNILLILADDVGPEVLGVYGGSSYDTPNLDALARSGMRFNHAYAMPVCHPSRICLLTGRYPFRLGDFAAGRGRQHHRPCAAKDGLYHGAVREVATNATRRRPHASETDGFRPVVSLWLA